jgi:hypothetical protein
MKTEDRKAAVAAYKKRKSIAGVFAVRCAASGQAWVGQALDLDTIQNRIWFSLRQGNHRNRDLQGAWSVHGEGGLSFETLERLKEDELPYVRDTLLRERVTHWCAALNGAAI